MPRGSKAKYTNKQKRMAAHIEEGEEKRGHSKKVAQRIAWATVNKETGGGKKRVATKTKIKTTVKKKTILKAKPKAKTITKVKAKTKTKKKTKK